ncbi:hypothetical protein [Hyphococcus sp.]
MTLKPQERQNSHHHDDKAYKINNSVHCILSFTDFRLIGSYVFF